MRRSQKVWDDPQDVDSFLDSALIGRVGTIGSEGPMIKQVNFVRLQDDFFFHSSWEGEKIEQIKKDPRVVFEVDEGRAYLPATDKPCAASYAYGSVIAIGTAEIVNDISRKTEVLNALMAKYQPEGGYPTVTAAMADKTAVVRIRVITMTAKEECDGTLD